MKRRRGYTIVELLMSLAVLAIGVSGVIAMQKVTLASNRHAKNLAVATGIAEAWADALAADATLWNNSADLGDTDWLTTIQSAQLQWFRPAWSANRSFGAGFSPLGDPVSDTDTAQARYCTHLRFAWLHGDPNSTQPEGSGLIRAEIRVFWPREGVIHREGLTPANAPPALFCGPSTNAQTMMSTAAQLEHYHVIYLTTAVAQVPLGAG
jgi:prepilin-type N-terminal cleavage/methylation domain-containing protein